MHSLQKRLFVFLSVTLILLVGFAGFRLYQDTHREVDALFDSQLAEAAGLLLAQAGDELREDDDDDWEEEWLENLDRNHHPHEAGLIFQLRDSDGRLRFRSSSHLPVEALTEVSEGFSDVVVHGRRLRAYAQWDPSRRLQIQIGQPETRRIAVAAQVTRDLLMPLFLVLPLSLLAVWLAVRSSLGSLKPVTAQVEHMAPGSLEPIVGPVPNEIGPLVEATNGLIARLGKALATERQFTADAAHELRTPLAGIRAQAEAALGADDPAVRGNALRMLMQGVDRAADSVDQLLTLARLDPAAEVSRQTADLHALAQNVLAHAAPIALNQGIELELTGDGSGVKVLGEPELLRLLIRNLVDNAIRFSKKDAVVSVEVRERSDAAVIDVTDQGPGIAPEFRSRIFDRFYRIPHGSQGGSGLGLAIVKQIAERHGAEVTVTDNPAGVGARFTVRFPAVSEIHA